MGAAGVVATGRKPVYVHAQVLGLDTLYTPQVSQVTFSDWRTFLSH